MKRLALCLLSVAMIPTQFAVNHVEARTAVNIVPPTVRVDLAQQKLLDTYATDWLQAAAFLASRPDGRATLEDAILQFRRTDNVRWTDAFAIYAAQVRPREVPDRMLPEYLADVQFQQTGPGRITSVQHMADFGVRARMALPLLQGIRDFSPDPEQVRAATEAIHRIHDAWLGRFQGC